MHVTVEVEIVGEGNLSKEIWTFMLWQPRRDLQSLRLESWRRMERPTRRHNFSTKDLWSRLEFERKSTCKRDQVVVPQVVIDEALQKAKNTIVYEDNTKEMTR